MKPLMPMSAWAGSIRQKQILIMAFLLIGGLLSLDFSLTFTQVALCLSSAVLTQAMWIRVLRLSAGYQSAIISGLGLCFLLRADHEWAHALAAFLAISSKFVLAHRRHHIFNPSALGVVLAIILIPGTWVSPGQWGFSVVTGSLLFILGIWVASQAMRFDISWFFLSAYLSGLAVRNLYLGYEWSVWVHALSNGSLVLFAFFMMSDPMTTSGSRRGRLLHASSVAIGALFCQYYLYWNHGYLYALLVSAVPVWLMRQSDLPLPTWNSLKLHKVALLRAAGTELSRRR